MKGYNQEYLEQEEQISRKKISDQQTQLIFFHRGICSYNKNAKTMNRSFE